MAAPDSTLDDSLGDFERRTLTLEGSTRSVYVSGQGPAVVVLAEMPGISPHVARFARWVRSAGLSVYMPSLFGRDGAYPEAAEGLATLRRACMSAELGALATGASSPVSAWLRALARVAHRERGGRGVGAVGMCFTGNFALSMMLEPETVAPVLCQPSLPLGESSALNISATELAFVRGRLEREDLRVLAYRFEGDRHCTEARFQAYSEALGPRFCPRSLPDAAAHRTPPPFFAEVVGCPHSVVTAHLVDAEGEPTAAARDEILSFLTTTLLGEDHHAQRSPHRP